MCCCFSVEPTELIKVVSLAWSVHSTIQLYALFVMLVAAESYPPTVSLLVVGTSLLVTCDFYIDTLIFIHFAQPVFLPMNPLINVVEVCLIACR